MKKIILILASITCLSNAYAGQKMYLDSKEVKSKHNKFYLHIGENVWVQTDTLQRDNNGLYTLESNVKRCPTTSEWEKMWKCPYCYRYWPIGSKCQNPTCPSKY